MNKSSYFKNMSLNFKLRYENEKNVSSDKVFKDKSLTASQEDQVQPVYDPVRRARFRHRIFLVFEWQRKLPFGCQPRFQSEAPTKMLFESCPIKRRFPR